MLPVEYPYIILVDICTGIWPMVYIAPLSCSLDKVSTPCCSLLCCFARCGVFKIAPSPAQMYTVVGRLLDMVASYFQTFHKVCCNAGTSAKSRTILMSYNTLFEMVLFLQTPSTPEGNFARLPPSPM